MLTVFGRQQCLPLAGGAAVEKGWREASSSVRGLFSLQCLVCVEGDAEEAAEV